MASHYKLERIASLASELNEYRNAAITGKELDPHKILTSLNEAVKLLVEFNIPKTN